MNEIYKKYNPTRITKYKSITTMNTLNKKYIIKKEKNDLQSLFSYLDSRNFNNYLNVIDKSNNFNVFEYISDTDIPINLKTEEEAKVVATLHNKTLYLKNVSLDNYKQIKEDILNQLNYLHTSIENFFLQCLKKDYMMSYEYLFTRNYHKYLRNIEYVKNNIESWYDKMVNIDKIRVCLIHNNLSIDHFIYKNQSLISFDNYITDTPVVDLYNLYKNDYLKINYSIFLNNYLKYFSLLDHEKKLLYILLNLPKEIILTDNNFLNTKIIKENIKYIDDAYNLVRSDDSNEEEK